MPNEIKPGLESLPMPVKIVLLSVALVAIAAWTFVMVL
jgi:hypothetical protein